jgi:hypothetical protein
MPALTGRNSPDLALRPCRAALAGLCTAVVRCVREKGEGARACLTNLYGQSCHFATRMTPFGVFDGAGVN